MLDLEIQREILDEINQKSDGKNPVKIDISNPIREMNFHTMRFDHCFSFFNTLQSQFHSSQQPLFVNFDQIQEKDIMTSLAKLSHHGHQYRFDINAILEKSQLQRENNEIMKNRIAIDKRNLTLAENRGWREFISVITSIVAAGISIVAITCSITVIVKSLPNPIQIKEQVYDGKTDEHTNGKKENDENSNLTENTTESVEISIPKTFPCVP
jgi:hypothetical protein